MINSSIVCNTIPSLIDQKQLASGGKFFTVGLLGLPVTTFVHELGHAVAMKMLFEDVNPKIYLGGFGFAGGETAWGGDAKVLSRIGNFFGEKASVSLVVAAGPLTETIASIGIAALTNNYDIIVPSLVANAFYCINQDPTGDFKIIQEKFPVIGKIFTVATLTTCGYGFFKSNLIPQLFYNYTNCLTNLICNK